MEGDMGPERIDEIGEWGLLERLRGFCAADLLGDDGALLPAAGDRDWAVTTDLLVDGVHFSDRTTPARSVGWRAVAANLSDLAAMGADPVAITVALALPGETAVAWAVELYEGMAACLERYGGAIAGGDLCRSPVKTISITALGRVPRDRALRRNAAQPGDAIVVTGIHGASRAGLAALLEPERFATVPTALQKSWIDAHQYPRPRFDAIAAIAPLTTHRDRPWCAMDSSDGLADALWQISRDSQVSLVIDRAALPLPPGLADHVGEDLALDWTLYGGEDFELVLALPPAIAATLIDHLGPPATPIGTVLEPGDRPLTLTDSTGRHRDRPLSGKATFQHFAP
jgi:thiamine-monophosphate kinase